MSTYSKTAAPTKQSADSVNQSGTITPSLSVLGSEARTRAGHNPVTHGQAPDWPRASDREKALEEVPVTLQGDSEILRRHLFTPTPRVLESRTGLAEPRGQLVDHIGHQPVRLLHTLARIID